MKDLFIFSIIQGITEFLPVSSTAHLIVLGKFFNLHSLGRLTEVITHAGTLCVVFVYFWKDIRAMIMGVFSLLKGKILPGIKLFFHLCLATLPVVGGGYILHTYFPNLGRSLPLLGVSSIVSGVILYLVDHKASTNKSLVSMTAWDALIIGCLQTIALIPGVSRSGATLIAARIRRYQRYEAARFSFLLSIPAVLGAITLVAFDFMKEDIFVINKSLLIPFCISFLVGVFILFLFMKWLKRHTLKPFAIYRILFGIFILLFFYCKM